MKSFIGKKIIQNQKENTNVNCIKQSSLPQGTRLIKPDSMITMDLVKDRLNLYLDDQNVVIKQTTG